MVSMPSSPSVQLFEHLMLVVLGAALHASELFPEDGDCVLELANIIQILVCVAQISL